MAQLLNDMTVKTDAMRREMNGSPRGHANEQLLRHWILLSKSQSVAAVAEVVRTLGPDLQWSKASSTFASSNATLNLPSMLSEPKVLIDRFVDRSVSALMLTFSAEGVGGPGDDQLMGWIAEANGALRSAVSEAVERTVLAKAVRNRGFAVLV